MQLRMLCILPTRNLKDTMRIIDRGGYGIAIVIDKQRHLLGVATDSDIRKALLGGISLESSIEKVMNSNPVVMTKEELKNGVFSKDIKDKILPAGSLQIPVVDKNKVVIDLVVVTEKGIVGKVFNYGIRSKAKKILIVGGAGYVGSLLCEKLLKKGYQVRVLDNLMYGMDGIKPIFHYPNFEFMYGDIRDIKKVMTAIKGVDSVVHLAAIVGDPASALNPEQTIESNYLASRMLAEICKYSQINRFIFASTCSVYGAADDGKLLTEESTLNPISLYAEMKLKSERGILELADENFLPTILRKGTLYGNSYRMRFDLVVNVLTIKAIKENQFKIFGGNQHRALCHVLDAVDAYVKCLEAPLKKVGGKVFNVVTDNLKILQIGEIVHKSFPHSKMIIDIDTKDARNYCVDSSKIAKIVSFKGNKDIIDGIDEIRKAVLKKKMYSDYLESKYSNVEFLRDKK